MPDLKVTVAPSFRPHFRPQVMPALKVTVAPSVLVGTSPKHDAALFPFPFLPGRLSLSLEIESEIKLNSSGKSNVNSKLIQSESNVKSSPLHPILLYSFGWLYRYFPLCVS